MTKEALIAWLGHDFTNIDNEESLIIFLRDNFDPDRLDELFTNIDEDEKMTAVFPE